MENSFLDKEHLGVLLGVLVVGIGLLLILAIMFDYFDSKNKLIADMVKAGVNPVAANCAIRHCSELILYKSMETKKGGE